MAADQCKRTTWHVPTASASLMRGPKAGRLPPLTPVSPTNNPQTRGWRAVLGERVGCLKCGTALALRAGLVAEQRQEPRRARVTFVRAAFAQNHASGRHALRAGRERRRQPRAARPVSPAVQDHGSLLVLKAKRELLHAQDRTQEANKCSHLAHRRTVEQYGMAAGKERGEAAGGGRRPRATRRGAFEEWNGPRCRSGLRPRTTRRRRWATSPTQATRRAQPHTGSRGLARQTPTPLRLQVAAAGGVGGCDGYGPSSVRSRRWEDDAMDVTRGIVERGARARGG